jgi:dienelactone hydrolase
MARSLSVTVAQLSVLFPLLFFTGATHAQLVRIEVHSFSSTTLTDQQILTGRKEGKPVTLAGELRIPRPGTDRLPAVVFLHGSGGISGFVDDWSQQLNPLGVATFLLDSFTGRSLVSTVNDQDQLARLAMTIDAYRALDLLAKHPRIDSARIAVMGFSRGGQAALYSSMKRLQRMHGPAGGVEFAAYITLYANCGTTYVDDTEITDKPIRMFHGSADDYVPVAPCRSYVERLRAKGKDVQLTEYAGAHHVFDWPFLKSPLKLAQAQTTRRCQLGEGPDGRIVNTQTGQPFTTAGDSCVEKGTTVAYNAEAHGEAVKAIKDFVVATLKPK